MTHPNTGFSLRDRRALVTGSSRGIGAAIALSLAEAGADVMIHYTGNAAAAHDISARIAALGRKTGIVQSDFSEPIAPRLTFDATVAALGGLDILVSNVSVQFAEPWTEVSRAHFDTQVAVNWRSAFELIQLAAPPMLERGWGRILTIGSVQENKPHPQMVVYSALKAAQMHMVKNLAKQFAPQGITVNNIAPGVILTDRNTDRLADRAYADKTRSMIPAGYFGEPPDCAGAALLLCSEAGRYITGQNLFVDGGMSL